MFTTIIATATISFGGFQQASPIAVQSLASTGILKVSSKKASMSEAALAAAEHKITTGKVASDKMSLTFSSKYVRLVVRTGPENDMMSYRIRGLRNPTITVVRGSTLSVLFANTDVDMFHAYRITGTNPPFESKMSTSGTQGSSNLPHMKGKKFFTEDMKFMVQQTPGTYYYVCPVTGHAAAGMYGKLIVK